MQLQIVPSFSYLGVVFTAGGSFSNAQNTLSGQAQKAVFKLNSYLYDFVNSTTKHTLELFDKLVSPILNYGAEVWGFCKANQIERVHMQFCKRLLGVKKSTQNNFIYGELGRLNYQSQRYLMIIKFWLKVVNLEPHKFVRLMYDTMLRDIEINERKVNWAFLVRQLLCNLGFREVWMQQNVGNCKPSMFKLIELFNTDRKKQIRNLSIFIFKAFEKRNRITYIRDVNI